MSYFPQLQHPQPVFPTDIINGDDDRPPPYSSPAPPEMGYASFPDVGPSVPRVTVPTSHPAHHADPRFPQKESFLDSRPSFSTPSPSSPPNQFIPDSQRPSAGSHHNRLSFQPSDTPITFHAPPSQPSFVLPSQQEAPSRRRRRRLLIIVGAIVTFIIVASVAGAVGAVVEHKHSDSGIGVGVDTTTSRFAPSTTSETLSIPAISTSVPQFASGTAGFGTSSPPFSSTTSPASVSAVPASASAG